MLEAESKLTRLRLCVPDKRRCRSRASAAAIRVEKLATTFFCRFGICCPEGEMATAMELRSASAAS